MKFRSALQRSLVLLTLIFVSYLIVNGQPVSLYKLPVGTRIKLKLDAEISSRISTRNDTFLATVSQPVMIRNTVVLAPGVVIEGRVTGVKPASSYGRSGKIDLVFESMKFSDASICRIDAVLVDKLLGKRNVAIGVISVLGGTAGGAVVGGLLRTENGAIIGSAIGAGIGTGVALARKGSEVGIKGDTEFEIVLRKEVVLPVLDY